MKLNWNYLLAGFIELAILGNILHGPLICINPYLNLYGPFGAMAEVISIQALLPVFNLFFKNVFNLLLKQKDVSEFKCLLVCLFVNSSEWVQFKELKFWGMIPLGVQMVLG